MPIVMSCRCGKYLNVDGKAGKRIVCPDCNSVMPVPGVLGVTPRQALPDRQGDVGPSERPWSEQPPGCALRKKKKRKAGSRLTSTLLVLLGVGMVACGFCCVGGAGLTWYLIAQGSPQRMLVGKWQFDLPETARLYPPSERKRIELSSQSASMNEFTSDGVVIDTSPRGTNKGSWRVLNCTATTLKIEVSDQAGNSMQFDITFRGSNRIHVVLTDVRLNRGGVLTGDTLPKGFVMKRV
jgi:hypothetical protein